VNSIKIGKSVIGKDSPCYIIAEMSANHDQDFSKAIEIIHAAKDAGANCVKIQTYTADTLTIDSNKSYFQIADGTWKGENLYKLYQKAYTPWEWQKDIKNEVEKLGMDFLSTAYDFSSVDFLENLGVSFYKIASFELIDLPLIKYIASKQKPILLSIGMASLGEIEEAINTIRQENNFNYMLLKCSSAYPAVPDDMNLSTIPNMKELFQVPIGFSDHSLGGIAATTAVALGAKIIEKHFCISRNSKGPDSSFSMEPHEFKEMVSQIRQVEKAMGKVSYKPQESEMGNRIFRKSIFVVKDIKAGEVFTKENIRVIRPAYGMHPRHYYDVLGKSARKSIEKGTPLDWNLIE
jgi:pseudaminic acid synthase